MNGGQGAYNCMSKDGKYMLVIANWEFLMSSNYGATWTRNTFLTSILNTYFTSNNLTSIPKNDGGIQYSPNWDISTMSDDGKYIFLLAQTFIATSKDYGVSWNFYSVPNTTSTTPAGCLHASGDGNLLVVAMYKDTAGRVYYSNNQGASWSIFNNLPNTIWTNIRISGNGKTLVAIDNTPIIYVSTQSSSAAFTSSTTFNSINLNNNQLIAFNFFYLNKSNISISDIGQMITILNADGSTNMNSNIIYSNDYGSTFKSAIQFQTNAIVTINESHSIAGIVTSPDGFNNYIIAHTMVYNSNTTLYIYRNIANYIPLLNPLSMTNIPNLIPNCIGYTISTGVINKTISKEVVTMITSLTLLPYGSVWMVTLQFYCKSNQNSTNPYTAFQVYAYPNLNQNYSDIFNTNIVTFDPNRYMPIWNSGNGIIVGEANNGQSYSVGGDYEFVKTGVFVNNFANYTPTILVGCYLSQLNTTNFTTCTKVTATRIA